MPLYRTWTSMVECSESSLCLCLVHSLDEPWFVEQMMLFEISGAIFTLYLHDASSSSSSSWSAWSSLSSSFFEAAGSSYVIPWEVSKTYCWSSLSTLLHFVVLVGGCLKVHHLLGPFSSPPTEYLLAAREPTSKSQVARHSQRETNGGSHVTCGNQLGILV